jgi:hypothetical protein
MDRRRFLGATAALGSALAVGCLDSDGAATDAPTDTPTATPSTTPAPTTTAPDKPAGIYVQSFQERMSMQGTATSGDYEFALLFAVPHDFWTVTGDDVSLTEATEADSLHLMAGVWDPETRTVLPETGLSVEIARDGDLVSQEVIYPMLSQPMSFHYGGNFGLDGDGTYDVTISVGGTSIRRTGAFDGRFGDPASVTIPLEFTEETRAELGTQPLDRGGQPGALRPMEMAMPQAVLPPESEMAGTVRGSAMADDARLVVTTLDTPPAGVDGDGTYLAVSARTRYNRYVLPAMALSATVERDGETVFEGPLPRTLDPDLRYHYGAVADVQAGDDVTLSVDTIPQVARHEGYETAFRQMDDVTVTL